MDHYADSALLVREPMLEGLWYPEEREDLVDAIHKSLGNSTGLEAKHGLLVPIGPLQKVGDYLGKACSALRDSHWDRVVLLGPCSGHRRPALYLPESSHFRTPLGLSPMDTEAADLILDSSMLVERNDLPHLNENALELSLAYLHFFLPNIPIVPLLSGESTEGVYRTLLASMRLLESEAPGRTLYVCNATIPRRDCTNTEDCETLWSFVRHGNATEILEFARNREFCRESLIILALVATFVEKNSGITDWFNADTGLGAMIF